MECFLNERSLPQLHDREQVKKVFGQFLESYKKAKSLGISDLKIHTSFFEHQFSPEITFHSWLHDESVDQDARTLFKGIMNSTPYLDDIEEIYKDRFNVLSMKLGDQPIIGLALASDYFFDTLSFSYKETGWDLEQYHPLIEVLSENENGDLKEHIVKSLTRNISVEEHCKEHETFISAKVKSTITTGKGLWLKKGDVFPNLIFCEQVKNQIIGLESSTPGFNLIVTRLFDLQKVASSLNGRPIKPEDFQSYTTPESISREKLLGNQLNFLCPDGQYGKCSWHSRYTPGAGRIHFLEEPNKNRITVGYIGEKIGI